MHCVCSGANSELSSFDLTLALQVLHPQHEIDWFYKAASVAVYCTILGPYIFVIWWILYQQCSLNGARCSYVLAPLRDPKHTVDLSIYSVFALTPTNATSRPKKTCDQILRRKKGEWHGGAAELRAADLYDALIVSLGNLFELWHRCPTTQSALTGNTKASGDDGQPFDPPLCQTPEQKSLVALIESLEQTYNRLCERTFFIGNACTWCFPRCNPAPETKVLMLVRKIRAALDDAAAGVHAEAIDLVISDCESLRTTRHEAHYFLSAYGTLFRKFSGPHRYAEVLLHVHTLAFALSVGLLQHSIGVQAVLVAALYFCKLCYYCVNPFNEFLRWVRTFCTNLVLRCIVWQPFEVAAAACFTGALVLVALNALEIEIENVGSKITYLSTGAVGCKIAYQLMSTLPVYCRLMYNALCSLRPARSAADQSQGSDEAQGTLVPLDTAPPQLLEHEEVNRLHDILAPDVDVTDVRDAHMMSSAYTSTVTKNDDNQPL